MKEKVVGQKCIESPIGMSNQVEPVSVQRESGISDTSNEHQGRNNARALLYDINGLEDDKFVNTMFNKTLNEITKHQAKLSCLSYVMWKKIEQI